MLTNALSAKAVASLKEGKRRDGQGLQFEVKGGSRWTFSYMFEGRQRELAIGKYPAMSLAEARAKRAELREAKIEEWTSDRSGRNRHTGQNRHVPPGRDTSSPTCAASGSQPISRSGSNRWSGLQVC